MTLHTQVQTYKGGTFKGGTSYQGNMINNQTLDIGRHLLQTKSHIFPENLVLFKARVSKLPVSFMNTIPTQYFLDD